MLVAGEVKGELARIHPLRACCRRAQLAGLLYGERARDGELRTLDHATARTAVHLGASLGAIVTPPRPLATGQASHGGRHRLRVQLDRDLVAGFDWGDAPTSDRRAFLRGVLLGSGSISLGRHGPHVEFVFARRSHATELLRRLRESGVRGALMVRRQRHVVYLKGQEEIAALLRLVGANRGLLDFETGRVGRDVRNRVNRLLNAEEANLGRTVQAADRQLQAISRLAATGALQELSAGLREAAAQRRRQPDADLDALAVGLGIGRSAMNHRLRRLIELAADA